MHTVTNMAKELKVERHVVLFIIESRNMNPICKAGYTNVYSAAQFRSIRAIIMDREGL